MAKMEMKKRTARTYFFWTAWPRPGTTQPRIMTTMPLIFIREHLNGIATANQVGKGS